ncbi:MAG TPA: hypothetical protein VFB81_23240 [Myxococcales bacterium]|nr:hypothetical protein [Myxococcales bacterium]
MSATTYFESIGFTLGVGLARARAAARLAQRPPPPRPPPARPKPAKRRTGPLDVGDQVVYRQGRGTFTGLIVRRALDGRFVVTRDKDGKRVLRPAKLLKRTR